MIIIKRHNLHALAKRHFEEFFNNRGFLNQLRELKDNETNILQRRFFTYLYDNVEDIIMGNPKCLSQILKHIASNNKFIMYQITALNGLEKKLEKKTKQKEELEEERKTLAEVKASQIKLSEIDTKIRKVECELECFNYYIGEAKELHRKIKEVFNYSHFSRVYGKGKWGAYELVKSLKIEVCPYCNRQFITITEPIKGEKGRTRPELDHFYSQSRYPFFAVSFFNLIPCCHVCNSNLKGNKETGDETHLNPYDEGFGDLVEFTVKFNNEEGEIDYINAWVHNPQMFSIGFKINGVEKRKYSRQEFQSLLKKINNNKRTFKLNSLYNAHTDYVGEIIVKSIAYNDDRIEAMCKDFPELFSGKEDAVRLLYSNYVEAENMDKRVLAKLTKDITKEFGIKYT